MLRVAIIADADYAQVVSDDVPWAWLELPAHLTGYLRRGWPLSLTGDVAKFFANTLKCGAQKVLAVVFVIQLNLARTGQEGAREVSEVLRCHAYPFVARISDSISRTLELP